jgi:hypothetical protein
LREDGAYGFGARDRERGGDRLFRPVLGGEAFDGAPEIDGRHGSAHDVFADRAHVVNLIGIFDEDVDLLEASIDRKADATGAVDDRKRAVFLRDGRGLQDADRFDAGGERCVRHFAGLDFSRIAGALLQGAGIDASQFHLISPDFISSKVFPR